MLHREEPQAVHNITVLNEASRKRRRDTIFDIGVITVANNLKLIQSNIQLIFLK